MHGFIFHILLVWRFCVDLYPSLRNPSEQHPVVFHKNFKRPVELRKEAPWEHCDLQIPAARLAAVHVVPAGMRGRTGGGGDAACGG